MSRVLVCELRNMIVVGGEDNKSALEGAAATMQEQNKGLFQERRRMNQRNSTHKTNQANALHRRECKEVPQRMY